MSFLRSLAQRCIESGVMTVWRRLDGTPARPEFGGCINAADPGAYKPPPPAVRAPSSRKPRKRPPAKKPSAQKKS